MAVLMGRVEMRVRELMDTGLDFTKQSAFMRAYFAAYKVSIDGGSIKKYGVKYQNERDAKAKTDPDWREGVPIPLTEMVDDTIQAGLDAESEPIAEVEVESAVMDAEGANKKTDDEDEDNNPDPLTSLLYSVNEVMSAFPDDKGEIGYLLDRVEKLGLKQFRAAYNFIKAVEE